MVSMSSTSNRTAISVVIFFLMAVFLMSADVRGEASNISAPAPLTKVVIPFEDSPSYGLVNTGVSWPLLSNEALGVQRQVSIDTQAGLVILRESVHGIPVGVPLVIGLDEYLRLRSWNKLQSNWRSFNQKRLEQRGESDSGSLFEIQIPVKFPKALRSIIGEGGPGLKVTGMRRISFAGRSEWTEGLQQTATSKPSKFPSLNMEQQSRFTIEGTIGSKISVSVDQDSERDNELQNNIQIRYTGEEDEIVQEIQAGNTTLALPNTEFVGYSENVRGLFGIRGKAQVGDLSLITIASQEKGSGASGTFQAGAQQDSSIIRDYDYKARSRYFLDFKYRDRYWDTEHDYFDLQTGIHVYEPADSIKDITVYVDDRNAYNNDEGGGAVRAWAYEYQGQEEYYDGMFNELEEEVDYTVDRRLGYILFKTPLQKEYVLAVRYTTKTDSTWWDQAIPPDTTFQLKLIKPHNPTPEDTTWVLEWKNIYDLRTRNIQNTQDFHVKIYKEIPSQPSLTTQEDGTPLLQIFGLDVVDLGGAANPDDEVDLGRYLVDLNRGELILPDHRPFDPTKPIYDNLELEDKIAAIYDSDDDKAKIDSSRYYIKVEFVNKKTTYSLGYMNVIDGSVVVTANGERLQEGRDYSVIYEIGQISLLSEKATNPNADVSVDFDYAPFFMPAQKTLLGTRAEYDMGENAQFGATALFRSEKTLEQKPRVGQEPTRTFVWDTDMALKFQPSIMSTAVNAIPLVETDQPSSFNISAEVAQSLPNPNTLGEAYIDDFEGSKEALNLSVMRTTWTKSSSPLDEANEPLPDSTTRGNLIWYNPWDRVEIQDIWPNKQTLSEESSIHTLNLEFTPDTSLSASSEEQWGGIMRYFSQGYWDQRRSKYLELWVRGEEGILNIDLGIISEDIDGDGILDTEDKIRNGVRDGILDEDEDTGLDGVAGKDGTGVVGDAGDDDWYYDTSVNKYDYRRINGTEGNADDPDAGRRPDTEDLDKSGYLEAENGYFQFSIDLSDTVNQVVGTESNGWRLYRVALRDSLAEWFQKKGTADIDWRTIKYARLWITGVTRATLVQIASLEIVGNKWEELGVAQLDSLSQEVGSAESFDLAVKNTHENEDYRSPPGVTPEKDRATNITKREQSLVMKFSNLRPGHSGSAQRILYSREDYTGYGELRMFVHGSEECSPGDSSRVEFYLRLGDSGDDYYEYHTPVYYSPGLWDSRNEVVIDFAEITGLKDALLRRIEGQEGAVYDTTDGNYRIYGQPSLSSVKWFEIGVINRSPDVVTGEIWLDELRVTDVRRVAGWAGRISVDAGFADFADFSFAYRKKDSEFHGLREKTGSGMTTSRRNIRGSLRLDKFLPANWGFSLPLQGSWITELQLPRLKPGSDIVLPTEQRQADRTESDTRTANISFSKAQKSGNWIVAWTLERIQTDLALSKKQSRTPTYPISNTSSYEASMSYDLTPRKQLSLKPLNWTAKILPELISGTEFSPLPSRLDFNSSLARRRTYQVDRLANEKTTYIRDLQNQAAVGFDLLKSLKADYSISNVMDLRDDSRIDLGKLHLGKEISRKQTATLDYHPTMVKFLSNSYSYRADYSENNDPNSGASGGRSVAVKNSHSVDLSLNFKKLFGNWAQPRDAEVGPGSPQWLVLQLRKLAGRVDPIRTNYQRDKNFNLAGLYSRPSWQYQLGLTDNPESAQNPQVYQNNRESISSSWSIKTGAEIVPGIDLGTSYKLRDNINRTPDKADQTKTVNFPDISIRWGNLNKLGPFGVLLESSSLDFGYSRKHEEKGDEGLHELTSESESKDFSPLLAWTARWKKNVSTTLKTTRVFSEQKIFRGSATTTKREEKTYSFNISYSFSSPQGIRLPLLGRIKFTSNLNLALDISTRQNVEKTALQGMGFNVKADTKELRVQPTASYSFSKNVSGGLNAVWMNSDDRKTNQKRRVRELGFWTELRF
jgi:hypothetical protein